MIPPSPARVLLLSTHCVLLANRVDFGIFLFNKLSDCTPPPPPVRRPISFLTPQTRDVGKQKGSTQTKLPSSWSSWQHSGRLSESGELQLQEPGRRKYDMCMVLTHYFEDKYDYVEHDDLPPPHMYILRRKH